MIGEYLNQLEGELRRCRVPAARLLKEVEGHLRDSADELYRSGLTHERAETQAIMRFGSAGKVAARFAQATASTEAQRSVKAASLAVLGYATVLLVFATGSGVLRDFPQGAASSFALQIAAVALVVAAVRWLRWRGDVATPSDLIAIARAVSIASGALVVAATTEAVVAVSRPAGVIAWSEARYLTLAFAAAFLVIIAAAFSAVRAWVRANAVARLQSTHQSSTATLGDALETLADQLGLGRVVRPVVRALLGHAWPATLLVAGAAFVAVTAVSLVGNNGLPAATAVGSIEAVVIVACFAAFGRLLGLRPAAA